MTSKNTVSRIALSVALALGMAGAATVVTTPVAVMAADAKKPTVSPAVGRPAQEAQKLLTENKPKEAAAKAQEALVAAKNPYEILISNQLLANASLKAGDYATGAKALDAMIASGQLPDATPVRKTLVQLYYQTKNYTKTLEVATAYLKDQPNDTEIPVLVAQSYYLTNDYTKASAGLRAVVRASDAAGRPVKEETLSLLMASDYALKNDDAVRGDLEMLVARYPKPQYTKDLISMYEKSLRAASSATKTSLDVYLIKFNTGLLTKPEDYTGMTELALQDGMPGLAKKVMDKGVADGVLGQGAQKDRENRMLNLATTQAAADQKTLAAGEAEAAKAKTGDALVKTGEAYWSYGMFDKAIAATEAGIAKGVTDADDAKLRLGIAYLGAGQRPKALEAWKGITPGSVPGQLAALWRIQK